MRTYSLIQKNGIAAALAAGLLFLINAVPGFGQCEPGTTRLRVSTRETHLTVAEYEDAGELLNRPTAIIDRTYKEYVSGEPHIFGKVDYHAIYPVSLDLYAEALMDLNGQQRMQPRVSGSRVICSNTDSRPHYHRMRMTVRIKFLFFKSRYDSVYNIFVHTPDPVDEYRQEMTLYESLDGKLVSSQGSWYLKEVEVDGRKATYVRYYYETGFTSSSGGLRFVLERFSKRQVSETMDSFYQEAERLKIETP